MNIFEERAVCLRLSELCAKLELNLVRIDFRLKEKVNEVSEDDDKLFQLQN